jgi:hypothetical protein
MASWEVLDRQPEPADTPIVLLLVARAHSQFVPSLVTTFDMERDSTVVPVDVTVIVAAVDVCPGPPIFNVTGLRRLN